MVTKRRQQHLSSMLMSASASLVTFAAYGKYPCSMQQTFYTRARLGHGRVTQVIPSLHDSLDNIRVSSLKYNCSTISLNAFLPQKQFLAIIQIPISRTIQDVCKITGLNKKQVKLCSSININHKTLSKHCQRKVA